MKIFCHDCNQMVTEDATMGTPLAEFVALEEHPHFPGKATYTCVCGDTFVFGPEISPDPATTALKLFRWQQRHKAHESGNPEDQIN